jgi:hypothetical protein
MIWFTPLAAQRFESRNAAGGVKLRGWCSCLRGSTKHDHPGWQTPILRGSAGAAHEDPSMGIAPRKLAFVLLAGLAFVAAGCSGGNKIVGKWKAVSMTDKDGKEEKADLLGMTMLMEFTSDGKVKMGMDMSGLPAEAKEKMSKEMSETMEIGTYKVSGDTLDIQPKEKSKDNNPFGKNDKVKFKVEGDTLSLTAEDGTLKLTRVK